MFTNESSVTISILMLCLIESSGIHLYINITSHKEGRINE